MQISSAARDAPRGRQIRLRPPTFLRDADDEQVPRVPLERAIGARLGHTVAVMMTDLRIVNARYRQQWHSQNHK